MDIISNLDTTITNLYDSVSGEIFSLLDKILLITPDILKLNPLKKVLNITEGSHIAAIVMCFITLAGICLVIYHLFSMYNGRCVKNPYKYIILVIVCAIVATNCMYLCKIILNIFDLFTNIIMELGYSISGENITFEAFANYISSIAKNMSASFLSIDGMIKGIIVFTLVNLLINFSVRYVWIIFLLLVTPIAIMLNISKASSYIFKSWYKSLILNLSYQVIVKFILIIPLSIKSKDELISKIILLGTMYILYKLNNFTQELFQNFRIGRE